MEKLKEENMNVRDNNNTHQTQKTRSLASLFTSPLP